MLSKLIVDMFKSGSDFPFLVHNPPPYVVHYIFYKTGPKISTINLFPALCLYRICNRTANPLIEHSGDNIILV